MRQKIFDGKSWIAPPSLIPNISRYPELMKQQRIPLRKFSALWDKKFLTENLDTPPPARLCINFFATENFLKQSTDGFLSEIFRHCETTNFWRKIVIPAPSLIPNIFRYQKHRRVTRRNFSALWDKKFSTDNCNILLHKVQKSVVELMFVKTLWKLISKQQFCF